MILANNFILQYVQLRTKKTPLQYVQLRTLNSTTVRKYVQYTDFSEEELSSVAK